VPHAKRVGELVLVTLPRATQMNETHFIALAAEGVRVRYFTLEQSSEGLSAFCEWDDGTHYLYGPLAVDETTFVEAVRAKLAETKKLVN
jgi:hypothetical protein